MKDHLISVIIPTYKNRGGLLNAINSVLEQDYQNIEVIVVDDNDPSSKYRMETENLMIQFRDREQIRYIKHNKNLNGAVARNTGVRYSNGQIISFLDDDDIFKPTKLKLQYEYLMSSNFSAVYCGVIINDIIQNPTKEGDLSKEILMLQSQIYTPTIMIYKSVYNQLNGFNSKYRRHQDYEFLLRFFEKGNKIGCVSDSLVVIGKNKGENSLVGKDLECLKKQFFTDFDNILNKYNELDIGFKKKVITLHLSKVLISHLKCFQYVLFIKLIIKNFDKIHLILIFFFREIITRLRKL